MFEAIVVPEEVLECEERQALRLSSSCVQSPTGPAIYMCHATRRQRFATIAICPWREPTMASRKFDEVAADLDDLTVNVDELHNDDVDSDKLADVKSALERAKDIIDDIADDEE